MEQDGARARRPRALQYTWNQTHFKPQVATYFLVNIFLYHKTIKFGTVVISTQRKRRGGFCGAVWKQKGEYSVLCTCLVPLLLHQPLRDDALGVFHHLLQREQGKNLHIISVPKILTETQTTKT